MGLSRFIEKNTITYILRFTIDLLYRLLQGEIAECPFCGGSASKRIQNSLQLDSIQPKTEKPFANVRIKKGRKNEFYFCGGCNRSYIPTTLDLESIINNLRFTYKTALHLGEMLDFYYRKEVSLEDLIRKHRTGIVRGFSTNVSYISESWAKKMLYICFNYKNTRTFANLSKTKIHGVECYTVKTMGVP